MQQPAAKRHKPNQASAIGGAGSSSHTTGDRLDFGSFGLMPTMPPSGAESDQWETFYAVLIKWVRSCIPIALKELKLTIKDILSALPARIKDNKEDGGGRNMLTTFRGDWEIAACLLALDTTGMYESGGVAHWLDASTGKVVFKGEVILDEHTPWSQVSAALYTWSWGRYWSSNKIPAMRRFVFSVTLPTAVDSTADAQKSIKVLEKDGKKKDVMVDRPTFSGCPVLAGRAHLIAMYYQMGECMTRWGEQDKEHFLKLWEACPRSFT